MVQVHTPLRGSAGGYAPGNDWTFQYYPPDTVDDSKPYEVVPLVSSRLMQMAGNPPLRLGNSKRILFFNEPSNLDPNSGDGITPQQGATLFWQYANQLPDAKILCCGDYYTPAWMDSFIALCNCLSRLSGIHFHDYAELWMSPSATDAQKLANWVVRAQAWVMWRNAHSGAYPTHKLELVMSEMGWSPCCEPDSATALRHMQTLCAQLPTFGLDGYAWFNGGSDIQFGTSHLGLLNTDMTPSPLQPIWSNC